MIIPSFNFASIPDILFGLGSLCKVFDIIPNYGNNVLIGCKTIPVNVIKELAVVLVDKVQKNSSIDWNIRETARAKMRIVIKRLLNKYGYPPDMQKLAIDMVIEQAEQQIRNEV